MSFSSNTYRFAESIGTAEVLLTRSGNEDNLAIVLVATDDFQGTASGKHKILNFND